MSIHETLSAAILCRRAVRISARGWQRDICPHALGLKDGRCRVLTFQYAGGSASGLPASGGWRTFMIEDIRWAEITDGAWHSAHDYVAKLEASFDSVERETRPLTHAAP